MMSYMLKNYVIGDTTAKKLVEVLEWSKLIWENTKNAEFLVQFLAELKCQIGEEE